MNDLNLNLEQEHGRFGNIKFMHNNTYYQLNESSQYLTSITVDWSLPIDFTSLNNYCYNIILVQYVLRISFLQLMIHRVSLGNSLEVSRHFFANVVDSLDIGEDAVRIGVIKYAKGAKDEIRLDDFFGKEMLKAAVLKIKHERGGT